MPDKDDITEEWLAKAKHDLGTAELLIESTDYYDIVVYHAHQCVEKILKWYLITHDEKFPFIHDVVRLLALCKGFTDTSGISEDIIGLQDLIPKTRYPSGETVTNQDAEFSVSVARKVMRQFLS